MITAQPPNSRRFRFATARTLPRAAIFSRAIALALATALIPAAPLAAEGLAGAYLAARQASFASDYANAAIYYTAALVRDPSNPVLLENSVLAQIGLGQVDRAIPIARRIQQAGIKSQFADLVMLADALHRKDYDQIAADFKAGLSAGPLVDGLVQAWAELGQGRMTEALAAFDTAGKANGLQAYALYHKALAMASAGDFDGADKILSGDAAGPLSLNRRGVVARLQILSQLERNADAVALIDASFDVELDPGMLDLRARLVAGEPLAFDAARDAAEGEAEVFLTLASALNGDGDVELTLIYARIAQFLRPENAATILFCADLLAAQKQYDLANQTYAQIPTDDPFFIPGEMGRADALYRAGKTDAALEVMAQLAKSHPGSSTIFVNLGDMLRRQDRFAEAATEYDRAIALLGEPKAAHWVIYYTRGIAQERLGNMDKAEADMRLALKLSPDQPQVLNYLGYAFVDAGRNLDEALQMIQRAVAARPDDGYIIDSLAWALYRMGRTAEAVEPMERAAELEAVDPIVNDHLGDVYWAVGRTLEAQFQWRRALSFKPEPDEEARIKRKLEVGLDVVLKEEGAKPPSVTADGN